MGTLDGKVAVNMGSSHGLGLAIVTSLDITSIASYKIV
jgi:hypothetical protein